MRNQGFSLPNVILTLVIVFCILYIGTVAVSSVVEMGDDGGHVSTATHLDGTQWVSMGDTVGKNPEVYNSLGYAINLTGDSNSYFKSEEDIDIASDTTWTVSTWARVDSDASSRTMTAVSADGRVLINYNGTEGNWTAWYYDDSGRQSYQINVTATDQPSNLTNVMVVRNDSTLTIYRNTTTGESVDLSTSSSVSAPVESENWDGRIDEVRTFDDALNTSQRSNLHSAPVAPLPDTNRTARMMFDQPGKKTQLLFFASGGVATSNAHYSDGLDGEQMDGKDLYNDVAGKTDYKWDTLGPRIQPVEGGQLEHAPVAYVSYNAQSRLNTLADDWNTAMGLAALLLIILPLGTLVAYLEMMGAGR